MLLLLLLLISSVSSTLNVLLKMYRKCGELRHKNEIFFFIYLRLYRVNGSLQADPPSAVDSSSVLLCASAGSRPGSTCNRPEEGRQVSV